MADSASSPLQSDIPHVALQTTLFQQALDEHLDTSKPDLLALRQVKEWDLEWTSMEDGNNEQSGSLEIHGEHMVVTLISKCTWTSPDMGTLSFSLSARARFRNKPKQGKKQDKVANRIRAEMMKRLRDDDYVKPLLEENGLDLCEAHIHVRPGNELEERVRVDDNVAEGVRRSIYSQSEGTLGLLDLLVSLPLLPSISLAQRAKLRLLEDAMVDACEKEGENELFDELTLKVDKEEDRDETKFQKRTKRL
jgi:hypothetical protein